MALATRPAAIVTPFVQQTPAWIDARRDLITASELPILTGNSQYATSPFSLFAWKRRDLGLEPEPIDPETQEMFDLGHLLEDDIAQVYSDREDRPLKRVNRLLLHPVHRWLGASLDRVSARKGERRIVEVKWVPHRHWLNDGPEPVPAAVQDQVQAQLLVSGYDVADVAVLSGSRVHIHELAPNAAYQDNLLYIAKHFHDLVESGTPPPIDGSEATRAAILRLHPRETLELLEPTAEIDALAADLRAAIVAKKTADAEDGRLRNVMRLLLGEHAGVEGDGYRVSFRKNADSSRTDWKAVAAAYRHLINLALSGEMQDGRLFDSEHGGSYSHAEVEAIAALHTEEREGARVLLPKFRDEETGRWV